MSYLAKQFISNFTNTLKNWRFKGFNTTTVSVGTPGAKIGVGGTNGILKVEERQKSIFTFKCVSIDAGIGLGSPVNITVPVSNGVGAGLIFSKGRKKITQSSFQGTYVALSFGSGFQFAIGTTALFMDIGFFMPIGTSPVDVLMKMLDSSEVLIISSGTAKTAAPNVGINASIGRSFLINTVQVPKPVAPVPSLPVPSLPVPSTLPPNYKIHTVVQDDWLSKIAITYYGDYTYWEPLYYWENGQKQQPNKTVVGLNPDLIQPGMQIIIPPKSVLEEMRRNGYRR